MKKVLRRLLIAVLTVTIALGTAITAFAESITMYYDFQYIKTVSGTNPYSDHSFTFGAGSNFTRLNLRDSYGNNTKAYCVEPGVAIQIGSSYTQNDSIAYWSSIPRPVKLGISRALLYGEPNKPTYKFVAGYAATQFIIWEFLLGWRDPDTGEVLNDSFQNSLNSPDVQIIYNQISEDIIRHKIVPSWMSAKLNKAPTITLKYDTATGKYIGYSPEDTNGVLGQMNLRVSGVSCTVEGDRLKLVSDSAIDSPAALNFQKPVEGDNISGQLVTWQSGSQQVAVTGLQADPVFGYLKVVTEQPGTLQVVKTSQDGEVSGRKFEFNLGDEAIPLITDTTGKASALVPPGTYTVREVDVDNKYIPPAAQTITVQSGQTTIAAFYNALKYGTGQIIKTAEGGKIKDRRFRITGNGEDLTVTTDKTGKVSFELPIGTYTVQEIELEDCYVQPPSQQLTIEAGKIMSVTFHNKFKTGYVKLAKKDTWTGGYLSNAVYSVYRQDGYDPEVSITTNNSQWVYSPPLPYGNYYLVETQAPAGYALDDSKYYFSIAHDGDILDMTVSDPPKGDMYPAFVVPNAKYRAGTEVVASYFIHNDCVAEFDTVRPLRVRFTAWYTGADGSRVVVSEQQKEVVVPRFSENLTYFKVTLPDSAPEIQLDCEVIAPNGIVVENPANSTIHNSLRVWSAANSETPDIVFENRPNTFYKPSDTAPVPNVGDQVADSSSWQQWEYEDGGFVLKTYGLTLNTQQELTPDSGSLSHTLKYESWQMKSGYGVSLSAASSAEKNGDYLLPSPDAYSLPQRGNAYFPEFQFESATGKYRTLELTSPSQMEFQKNPNTMMKDGTKDYRRTHFTPLWMPDGSYVVKTYLYDCWTPAGMLSTASTLSPILIDGNMYQDWYISHN